MRRTNKIKSTLNFSESKYLEIGLRGKTGVVVSCVSPLPHKTEFVCWCPCNKKAFRRQKKKYYVCPTSSRKGHLRCWYSQEFGGFGKVRSTRPRSIKQNGGCAFHNKIKTLLILLQHRRCEVNTQRLLLFWYFCILTFHSTFALPWSMKGKVFR